MSTINLILKRFISLSAVRTGKRNFRKFQLFNKRGTRQFKARQATDPFPDMPIHTRGVKPTGYTVNNEYVEVPEMIPQLVVPDLTDFKLKPYVSYRAPDVTQAEFTAQDLFNVVYGRKIANDFKEGNLNEDGSPKQPSKEEKLTPEEAKLKADQTGTDLFCSSR